MMEGNRGRLSAELFRMRCTDLPDPALEEAVLDGIPEGRRREILRFRFPDDRKRSLTVTLLLGRALRERGLDLHQVRREDGGKPFVSADPPFFFSLSHAAEFALLAISERGPVGCDIEQIRGVTDGIAERYFSDAEKRLLLSCHTEEEKRKAFFRVWTGRESYIKMTGEGMRLAFERYTLLPADPEREEPAVSGGIIPARDGMERVPHLLPVFEVSREGIKEDCLVWQSVDNEGYCISVCAGR